MSKDTKNNCRGYKLMFVPFMGGEDYAFMYKGSFRLEELDQFTSRFDDIQDMVSNINFRLPKEERLDIIDAYIERSRTMIYKEDNKEKYKHFDLIKYLYNKFPQYVIPEIGNLSKLKDEIIEEIVNKIPGKLLTNEHKKYIILYIFKRRNMLLNIR